MVITEVRIKLCEENNERLLAFCSVTFDNAFVVRDLKIIEGTKGVFVAMPSRKLTDRCNKCGCKNHLRARFCNSCGLRMDEARATRDMDGRAKLHADIAHPIHSGAREMVQSAVIRAYQEEKERSKCSVKIILISMKAWAESEPRQELELDSSPRYPAIYL